ncbi:MAG TPA: hypothetical protein VF898_06825 [Chloroflexota bacterium]
MYLLIVKGARRATLAVHRLENRTDLQELLKVYQALGFESENLIVEEQQQERAA